MRKTRFCVFRNLFVLGLKRHGESFSHPNFSSVQKVLLESYRNLVLIKSTAIFLQGLNDVFRL